LTDSGQASRPILEIKELTVAYQAEAGWQDAVRDFSLDLVAGQTCGLVGESGSGKTTIALAIMRYLGRGGAVRHGQIRFDGQDLLILDETGMRRLWGKHLAMVPQDPLSSLNPSIRAGEQLAEALRYNQGLGRREAAERAVQLLQDVRVPDARRIAESYPHQLSGGMQQRVMIAMALSAEPQLLVLDEPTTNLDVTTQAAILDLIAELIRQRGTATLYVTHNLGVVARICDRVAVLYAGELVEDGPTSGLYRQPLHPYTQGLLDSVPLPGQRKYGQRLRAIPGYIPSPGRQPAGCIFAPRCPLVVERCLRERPPVESAAPDRRVRCFRWREIAAGDISARQEVAGRPVPRSLRTQGREPELRGEASQTLLTLRDVSVHFDTRRSLAEVVGGRGRRRIKAVDGLSLAIAKGQTLGLVGESGSGKTTLARAVIGLAARTEGDVEIWSVPLAPRVWQRDLEQLRHVQYVFQNPEEALNPYLTIGETLRRPFMSLLGRSRREAGAAALALLAAVRLPASYLSRLPHQLSGGEKQRVAIARAFATNPDLLIADEAVSALDVSIQASILNLLDELQCEQENALLFISHDLAVVGYLADLIAVMYAGCLMELSGADDLFEPPYHPYTEALLSAIPVMDPRAHQERIRLEGDLSSQGATIGGCPFHPRCPRRLGDICANQRPPWQEMADGKRIFCHIPAAELAAEQEQAFKLEAGGQQVI
jgi:peptide/nickel transport system ATP-binding protein